MHAKLLKSIWLTALFLALGALLSLYRAEIRLRENLQGDLIFADNLGNSPNFSKIVIETPAKQISLQKEDNLWRIPEADNYYASFAKVQNLLDNILSAHIGKSLAEIPVEIVWKNIELFNQQEQKTASIMIGKLLKQNVYYVRYPEKPEIYLSTWKMDLPDDVYSWTRQPLLEFESKNIKSIEKNNILISRREEGEPFYNTHNHKPYHLQDYMRIFTTLTDLHYEKVLSSQEFSPENYPHRQTLELTTFDGLITIVTIYSDLKDYWIQINLSTNRLPRQQATEYVAQNKILYEDWWFKIDETDGQGLFNFRF